MTPLEILVITLCFLFLIYLIKSFKETKESIKESEKFIENVNAMIKEEIGIEI